MNISIPAYAFSALLLGASAAAGAAGISPSGQFASTGVLFRGDVKIEAPTPHSGVAAAPVQTAAAQPRKPQAPSSYALHGLLQRAPVNPAVVRAQGE